MRRGFVLGALIVVGALSMAAGALQAPPPGLSPPALEATKIEKVRDNLYMITGSDPNHREAFSGGNTVVFVTGTGVVVIDTKLAGWGQVILDRIKTVTDKPVTTIINTHTHGDHTGSNEFFGAAVEIVAQENTKANMEKMPAFEGDKARFLPKKTYKDKMSLLGGADKIDLYYFGAGHTNGDSFVVFPSLGVMHAGDMFAGKNPPLIDTASGASGVAYPKTLKKAAETIKGVDTIITGHSTLMTWPDLSEFAQFNQDFLDVVERAIKAGQGVDEIAAAWTVPDKYKGYTAQPARVKANVQAIANEIKKK
jgi:cyclase